MKRKLMLLLACLLASIGLVIAQTPKKVTGVVISEEDHQPSGGRSGNRYAKNGQAPFHGSCNKT